MTALSPAPVRPGATSFADARRARQARGLSWALIVVTAPAALLTILADLLNGPAVMNGSARGTALVMLVAGLPALAAAAELAGRGSRRSVIVWLGAAMYLVYNSVMLLLATPFNELFLAYVAMLALSLATVAAIVASVDTPGLAQRFDPRTPVRGIAAYLWVVAGVNALLWLRGIVPGLTTADSPAFLAGTGLTTSPTYVQDLSFWLPLAAVAGAWLWQRRSWGFLLSGGLLTMWVIEGLTVATDQWFGHRADPASTVVSEGMVVPFLALAVVGLVPLLALLRRLR